MDTARVRMIEEGGGQSEREREGDKKEQRKRRRKKSWRRWKGEREEGLRVYPFILWHHKHHRCVDASGN